MSPLLIFTLSIIGIWFLVGCFSTKQDNIVFVTFTMVSIGLFALCFALHTTAFISIIHFIIGVFVFLRHKVLVEREAKSVLSKLWDESSDIENIKKMYGVRTHVYSVNKQDRIIYVQRHFKDQIKQGDYLEFVNKESLELKLKVDDFVIACICGIALWPLIFVMKIMEYLNKKITGDIFSVSKSINRHAKFLEEDI